MKDIIFDVKVIVGFDIVKVELSYVGNFFKVEGVNIENLYVDMNVIYFKNYD